MNFSERLISLLSDKGISQVKLLKELKLGKNSINYWKNNNAIPNGETLNKIADYLDVSVDYLLGRKDKSEVNR